MQAITELHENIVSRKFGAIRYVTKFVKRGLIHTQFKDILFIASYLITTPMNQQYVHVFNTAES